MKVLKTIFIWVVLSDDLPALTIVTDAHREVLTHLGPDCVKQSHHFGCSNSDPDDRWDKPLRPANGMVLCFKST